MAFSAFFSDFVVPVWLSILLLVIPMVGVAVDAFVFEFSTILAKLSRLVRRMAGESLTPMGGSLAEVLSGDGLSSFSFVLLLLMMPWYSRLIPGKMATRERLLL